MRLKYQLFLILLLAGSLLIALMAAIGSWSFDRGFIGYINDTEGQRLDPLIDTLATGYAREGNWDWITDERNAWPALIDRYLGLGRGSSRSGLRRDEPDRRGRPGDRQVHDRSGPEPRIRPPSPAGSTLTLDPRLLLADADQRVLIGRVRGDRQVSWQPVTTDDQVVGYVGHHLLENLPGQLDQAFAVQQRRTFLYAALAMVLLSAPLAVALAGRLVRPLLKVNDAVARIGKGQFEYRVPDERSDEIGDLSRSINTLAFTLEKNLDARRQWLAEISHELRTPVAVLQGEIEAIQDGVAQLDSAAIASLHAETLRLARLIDDLHDLTLSDVGALDYHFERIDLRDVLSARVAAVCSLLEATSLAITVTPSHDTSSKPLFVNGDTQRLGQLIDNLLQNSMRYTQAGGEVRIALSQAHGRATMDWSDSAPGVDDEQLGRLFEPLYRADKSRSRGNGGAGLGLAIVQRIIEAHGGTIAASQSSLGGLALHVELPLSREKPA